MENKLKQLVEKASAEMDESWFVASHTGETEDMRDLIYCTEKYDSLSKELKLKVEEDKKSKKYDDDERELF